MSPFTAWDDYRAEIADARAASTDEPYRPTPNELDDDGYAEPRPAPPVDHVRAEGCCEDRWLRHEGEEL